MSKWSTLVLLLILLAAAALRFYRIDAQSLWSDEGSSVAQSLRDIPTIVANAARDIHPPLYYILLHFWVMPFGTSEVGVRSLSAVLGVALVWLCYLLGRALWDARTGLLAAALAAINPFQIYYSQEARMYMLLTVLGALCVYATIRVQGTEDRRQGLWYLAYLLAAIMGLYTHYFFPIVLAVCNTVFVLSMVNRPSPAPATRAKRAPLRGVEGILLSLERRGATEGRSEGWSSLAQWIVIQLITFLAFIAWLPTALRQITTWPSGAQTFSARDAPLVILRVLGEGLSAPSNDGLWLALLVGLLTVGMYTGKRGNKGTSRPMYLSASVPVYLLAPVLVMFALALFKDAFLKFLLVASPPFVLLVANGISNVARCPVPQAFRKSQFTNAMSSLCLLIPAILSAPALQNYYFDPRFARDDYRAIAQTIDALARSEDAIILNAPGQQEIFTYYYHGALPINPLPRQRPLDVQATQAELAHLAQQHARIFAVLWATDESDPQRIVESWLATHLFKASDTWYGNVRLAMYASANVSSQKPLNLQWEQGLTLLSYGDAGSPVAAGEVLPLTLLWRTAQPISARYKVFVHLLDPRGFVIAQRDSEPVGGSRPTTTWRTGETIQDSYGLFVPFGTPPHGYRIEIGLYDLNTGQRLSNAGGNDSYAIGPFQVLRPNVTPPLAVYDMQRVDRPPHNGLQLLGYQLDKLGAEGQHDLSFHAGDALHLVLFWRKTDARADGAYRWQLASVAKATTPTDGLYPITQWSSGEIVRDDQIIVLPNDWRAGRYVLEIDGKKISEVEVR